MSDDYEVGYGKPPKDTQFKPGQSGNPNGRPKGARNLKTEIREVMQSTVTVTQDGKRKKISTRKAVVLRLTEKALSGNVQATCVLIDLMKTYDEEDVADVVEDLSQDDAVILEMFVEKIRNKETPDE